MGALFSTPKETLPPEQSATLKSRTDKSKNRDGRSYAEVVRAGPETSAMSKLQQSGASWKFVSAPKDEKM